MKERLFFNPVLKLSKNKTLELQSGTWEYWSYFDFVLRWDRHTDHAGFLLDIEILGLYFIFTIYDNRHWDYEKDQWQVYEKITPESHPEQFNEDGSQKFISPGISTTESA